MTLCAKVRKKDGEDFRRFLIKHFLLDPKFTIARDDKSLYFPVTSGNIPKTKTKFEIVNKKTEGAAGKTQGSLKEILKGALSEKEIGELTSSYDIIGNVAVIHIPDTLEKKEKKIAQAVMQVHKNVKTVLKQTEPVSGEFRVRGMKHILGEKSTVTAYKEHGCVMEFDVSKVYFSPRLSHERRRIAEEVKAGEDVLVMFAGVGPFALVIAKKQPKAEKIAAVEMNPDAVEYMQKNIIKNKMSNRITAHLGDVRDIVPNLGKKFDRVLMPLPKGAEHFLDVAVNAAKKGGVIHFYHFSKEGEGKTLFSKGEGLVKETCKALGRKHKVLFKRIVRPFAPYVWQVVIDFKVL